MKSFCLIAATLVATLTAAANVPVARAETIEIQRGSFAAVAYSPSTRRYYYAYNHRSRGEAEQAALRGLNRWDGRVAGWVNEGFFALAVGSDGSWRTGWSYGNGASNSEAADYALRYYRNTGRGARVVCCLSSDGQYVFKW